MARLIRMDAVRVRPPSPTPLVLYIYVEHLDMNYIKQSKPKTNHPNHPELYQCVHCFKQFFNEELLNTHMYFHVNCYKCHLCDMTCPSPSALAKHVRQRHIDLKPFACKVCPYRALLKKDLERHNMTQHEQHVYECDEFGCAFKTTSYYAMRMVSDCRRDEHIQTHTHTHTKPSSNYYSSRPPPPCTPSPNIQHDKRVHCGIGPSLYACHCCVKRFQRGTQLSDHLIEVHQFQLPSGHSRFTYSPDMDGLFRVQTMRMESLEVTQAIMSPSRSDRHAAVLQAAAAKRAANVTYELSPMVMQKRIRKPDDDTNGDGEGGFEHAAAGVLSVVVSANYNAAESRPANAPGTGDMEALPRLRFSEDDSSNEVTEAARRKSASRKAKVAAQRRLPATSAAAAAAAPHLEPEPSGKIKNIQDFSVMKRYLRKENATDAKITIELTKVDASGNVLRSETMCAKEFQVE